MFKYLLKDSMLAGYCKKSSCSNGYFHHFGIRDSGKNEPVHISAESKWQTFNKMNYTK